MNVAVCVTERKPQNTQSPKQSSLKIACGMLDLGYVVDSCTNYKMNWPQFIYGIRSCLISTKFQGVV